MSIKRRIRIKTACDPQLELLFKYVNVFPAAEDMKDFPTPVPPMKALTFFGLYDDKNSNEFKQKELEFQNKELEYQEALFKAVLKMLDGLKERGFITATHILAHKEDWDQIIPMSEELDRRIEEAWIYYENAATEGEVRTEAERTVKFQGLADLKNRLIKRKANYARSWIDKYYRVRSIKKLLGKLASEGRDFNGTEKRLENAGLFFDLNSLIPDLLIDENGILHREEDPAMKLLLGLDVRRIRECKTCENFFWANRTDRMCCENKKCGDAYNQKLSRDRKRISGKLYNKAAIRKRNKATKKV